MACVEQLRHGSYTRTSAGTRLNVSSFNFLPSTKCLLTCSTPLPMGCWVEAFPSGIWTRIRIKARVPGPEGNGIAMSVNTPEGASAILTPFNDALCCANEAGSPITDENPAMPGETIVVYATGLGLIKPDVAQAQIRFGAKYQGPALNEPLEFVSSLLGGKTANVLATGLKPGAVGVYEVHLELNSSQPTNPLAQLTIAQSDKVSNIATVPVFNPKPASQ